MQRTAQPRSERIESSADLLREIASIFGVVRDGDAVGRVPAQRHQLLLQSALKRKNNKIETGFCQRFLPFHLTPAGEDDAICGPVVVTAETGDAVAAAVDVIGEEDKDVGGGKRGSVRWTWSMLRARNASEIRFPSFEFRLRVATCLLLKARDSL
jgi:hypothetical protein